MKHFTLIRELFYTFHFFAGLLGRYYISVPPCPDSRLGNGVPPKKMFGGTALPRVPSTTPRDVSHNNDFQWIDFVL